MEFVNSGEVVEINDLKKMSLKQYQNYIKNQLQTLYRQNEIQVEWDAMKGARDFNIYSPRIDVAVGPFALYQGYETEYDEMLSSSKVFIEKLIEFNRDNLTGHDYFVEPHIYEEIMYQNRNARCFMAIEIENQVSRKHLMGGAINASALARVGIVIPWTDDKLNAFVRLVRYLHYLKLADKNTFNTTNLLIVTKEQFLEALNIVNLS
ncbi:MULTISPECIES: hypothetical protein [Bacillus cereus group]|uniref:Uncharacterized protein n=2 Tax=Bacillus cereus group TaxID=86661 RepID=A0A9X6ZCF0_BACCE|nr:MULTISPECIES: hypothetical protein [Bacillus cereus group]AHX21992.1 hypothetical protein CY96_29830 [Bacillus bombysepticus str. Wang]PFF41498.1 hypothetical protein CN357_31800 [Bacillus cereus]PFO41267.1 hypothetical protein COJ82_04740 [Bacillus cereus]PGT26752.1 hypothetical protein COC99_11475 [Bacillus cereus]